MLRVALIVTVFCVAAQAQAMAASIAVSPSGT